MKRDLAITLAWAMAMMVSPEALIQHSRFSGLNGSFFIFPLLAALILHWFNAKAYDSLAPLINSKHTEIKLLISSYGRYGALVLLLLVRPAMAVFLATATLVTSGFAFNETFVYWFPNFAFAALLLSLVILINLAGSKAASVAQAIFTFSALAGIVLLIILGFILPGNTAVSAKLSPSDLQPGASIFLGVILFLGYEITLYSPLKKQPIPPAGAMRLALIVNTVIFIGWDMLGLKFLPVERLASSTIAHTLTAKSIAGQTGRYIIALVSIMGSLAVTNALFYSVARMAALMGSNNLLPGCIAGKTDRSVAILISLGIITAMAMMLGVAGSDYLDIAIRAGLLAWLLFYIMIQLARLIHLPLKGSRQIQRGWKNRFFLPIIKMLLFIASFMGLLFDYPDFTTLFYTLVVMLGMTMLLAGVVLLFTNQTNRL